ncbi:MAG: hypothetical protein ACRD2U_03835 [Terriglobales bacterium]
MPFLEVDEFRELLRSEPLDRIVTQYVFGGTPYVFRQRPANAETLYHHLSGKLAVDARNIRIVGSAKMGFSLSPDTFSRRFLPSSDIDVVVVDEGLFDGLWLALLNWHYPRRTAGLGADNEWGRQRRRDIYWGCFSPEDLKFDRVSFPQALKPVLDISTTWFNAFRTLSHFSEFTRRNVSGRLYRTWHHAEMYHKYGLQQVLSSMAD